MKNVNVCEILAHEITSLRILISIAKVLKEIQETLMLRTPFKTNFFARYF